MSNNGTLVRNLIRGGSAGGGSPTEIALLSVTTAPSGSFAVGSKYYNSSTKKIVTAVTADTWTGATSADPVFNVIYTFNSGYYIWDGDNLVTTDLDTIVRGVKVNGVSVVDENKIAQITISNSSSVPFSVKSSNVDSNGLTDIASINEIINGGCSVTSGVATGGSGKYLQLVKTAPIATADSWEIKTKYYYNGGGTFPTIFGYQGSLDWQVPCLLIESDVVKLYASSSGATWDLFTSEDMNLTLTATNTYYFKLSYDSITGYKFEHSTDGTNYTTSWTSATTTKAVCNVPYIFLNLGLNLTTYYSSGEIDLSETTITIDSEVWWDYTGDTISFKIDDGTLYAPLTIVSADGTETTLTTVSDLDLSSFADGRINIFFGASGAVAYNNTIFNQPNEPAPNATNDVWFNNLDEAKKWNGSAWETTDLVFGLYVIKNGILETYRNVPINYNGSGSLENVMYFAPTGAGMEDGSSWENAKAFTSENYTAMPTGYTALLKYGTYAVPWGFDTIKGKNIIGGFTGIETEKIKPYVISTNGVWGASGNTTFNDYATIFTQDFRTKIHCYVEGIVFYRHNIEVNNYEPETSAGRVHNCIIANNASGNEISRGVTVSDTLFLNGMKVYSDIDESASLFVYFTGCHFKNTRDTSFGGGAVFAPGGWTKPVYLINCKFENCTTFASVNGGGACCFCTVISCIAIGCKTANMGGAFYGCAVKNSSAIGCTADVSHGAFAGCTLDNATAIGCNAPAYPAYNPNDSTGTPIVTPRIDTNTVFTQTEDKTIANTTVETSLVGAGVGSMTLPAYLLTAGKTLFVKGKGFLSGLNGESATLKVKLGATELINSVSTYPKAFSEVGFDFELLLTCRTIGETGTVIAQGGTIIYDGTAITTSYNRELKMTTTATINTTIAQLLDFTYTFGTADSGNTITLTNLIVETLN